MVVANPFVQDSRVLKEAKTLVERGLRVTVVGARAETLPADEEREGIRIVRVPRDPLPARVLKAIAGRRRLSAGSGGGPVSLPPNPDVAGAELAGRRAMEALTNLRFWRRALIALLRAKPDLVIAHDLDALPAGYAAARAARVPLIYDSHELFLEMPPLLPRTNRSRKRWMAAERRMARAADLVVTVSDGIADELVRRYGIARPLVVRNVPRRLAPVQSEIRAELRTERPIAAYAGGIHPGRGLEELVQAMEALGGDVLLAMIGSGEPSYVDRLVARAPQHVRVLQPVVPDQVSSFLRTADVGVVPYRNLSLNHWFALPTKLFEYLGAGLPVVAGDLLEVRRIVTTFQVGQTCDTDDPAAIARAIRRVLADAESLRANVAAAAAHLNWTVEGARYGDAVERLLASSS
jgi:glycosyltransferase involved in cell wall biosynthesis